MNAGHTVRVKASTAGERDSAYTERVLRLGLGTAGPVVGRGSMGVVVKLDGFPGAPGSVAVKVLREELAEDPESVERFRRELTMHRRLWKEMQAPRLVPCLAVGATEGPLGLFGVLPYYSRGCLASALEELSLNAALRCVADAAEGLGALHGHGYIHRDLCPKNIFVSEEGGALRGRVGDLGVAVPLDGNTLMERNKVDQELSLTVGHLGYIDPWNGGLAQGDLYSLGATLYFVLTGTEPPQQESDEALLLPGWKACRPGVGEELRARAQKILVGLMARDAQLRFSSASEAATAIQDLAAMCGRSRPQPMTRRGLVLGGAAAVVGVIALTTAGLMISRRSVSPHPNGRPVVSRENPQLNSQLAEEHALQSRDHESSGASGEMKAEESPGGEPEDSGETGLDNVPEMVQRATTLVAEHLPASAESLLKRALETRPTDPEASSLLALILSKKAGNSQEASAILRRCLAAHPRLGSIRLQLARILAAQGDLEQAMVVLDGTPKESKGREDIERFQVTLERLRRRRE